MRNQFFRCKARAPAEKLRTGYEKNNSVFVLRAVYEYVDGMIALRAAHCELANGVMIVFI